MQFSLCLGSFIRNVVCNGWNILAKQDANFAIPIFASCQVKKTNKQTSETSFFFLFFKFFYKTISSFFSVEFFFFFLVYAPDSPERLSMFDLTLALLSRSFYILIRVISVILSLCCWFQALPLATFFFFRKFIGGFDADMPMFASVENHLYSTFCGAMLVLGSVAIYLLLMSLVDLFVSFYEV